MSSWFSKIIQKWFPQEKVEEQPKFNLIPSPIDLRDVKASDVLGAVSTAENPTPESISCPYVLTQKDQGVLPICVGESGATMNEYEKRRQGLAIEFDAQYLYDECKKIDGIPDVKGTYFRAVLSVLKNKGAKPVGGTEADAANYKIGGYVQVDPTFDSIKRAIWKWGTVLMGFYIYSNGSWNGAYIKKTSNVISNGHATIGKSFTKEFIKGQNSFGADWGDNGDFYVPESYLPFECWAIVSDIPTTLLPDPNAKPKYQFENDLYAGLNNDEVKKLQDCLVWLGCMKADDRNTGYGNFGQKTLASVKIFQGRYGITQNGRVGPITRAKLNELFA